MATKKAVLPSKKAPPPPKTRPGVPISPNTPKVSAPSARTSVYPPASRPVPKVAAKPAPAPAPAPVVRNAVVPPPPAPTPVRPQPVGPKSLPPSDAPVQYRRGMETFEPQVIQPMYEPEVPMPAPEQIYDAPTAPGFKRGGFVKKADGIAKRGKTKGRYI